VTIRSLFGNTSSSLIFPSLSLSKPNIAFLIVLAENLWNCSKLIPATSPLTFDAIALQASPTKSFTLKIFDSIGSFYVSLFSLLDSISLSDLLILKCQL